MKIVISKIRNRLEVTNFGGDFGVGLAFRYRIEHQRLPDAFNI
jgi:hypothetical protein